MWPFLKTFWGAMVSIGTVVALGITAEAEDLLWAFWLTLAASGTVAFLVLILPRALKWLTYVRGYPALLTRVATAEEANRALERQLSESERQVAMQYDAGVSEGRAQISGALLSNQLAEIPTLVGVETDSGLPTLLATADSQIPIGCRFVLEVSTTGSPRGVVEVRTYDHGRKLASMVCVETDNERFWQKLAEMAEADPSPPKGVRLQPPPLPWSEIELFGRAELEALDEQVDGSDEAKGDD